MILMKVLSNKTEIEREFSIKVSAIMSHVTYKYLFSPKSFDIIIRARYHHDIRVALNVTSSEMRENK